MALDVVHALPGSRDAGGRLTAYHGTYRVVESDLVVEIVEMSAVQVVAVLMRIVHFGDEQDVGMLRLHLWDDPSPEVARHHLSHVATESVHTLRCPEQQNVAHLQPCARSGRTEYQTVVALIVHAVVQFHRLIPVVLSHPLSEAVIARHLGRCLHIVTHLVVVQREIGCERRAWQVIEIVLRVERHRRVVLFAQILHVFRLGIGMILASHVVGHEVDDHLQIGLVSTHHQILKLLHALWHLHGQIGVDVVVVLDGIRTAGIALHHCGMILLDAILRVVSLRCMLNETRVPDVGRA